MPLLREVLPDTFQNVASQNPDAASLLDVEVEAIMLNNGSPCEGHAALFTDWVGEGEHVRQWFLLSNGKAVAVDEIPDSPWRFPVIDYEVVP